jgi:hypothetical protein
MSSAPDHLDPKEATEAKLCAYLEGELSPEERLDIEAHLKSNPQHRQLLIDLAETRQWMRQIPHEPAPADLAESVAAQLERSILLDDRQETGDSPIVRLPQYALLAAVVLLTLGLGVLIMAMLRGGQTNYSLATRAPAGDGSPAAIKSSTTTPVVDAPAVPPPGDTTADKLTPAPMVAAAPAPTVVTAPAAESETHAKMLAARRFAADAPAVRPDDSVNQADLAEVQSMIRDRKISGDHPRVCLIVSSPDPAATGAQVRRFFGNNQVVFDDEQSTVIEPSDKPAVAAANNNNAAGGFENQNGVHGLAQQNSAAADNFLNKNNAAQQNQIEAVPTTQPAGKLVYVGRNMTPLQVELLHGTLAAGGIDQTIRRLNLTPPAAAKSLNAVTDSSRISRGQTLTITVPQLVGPGIDKTNVVKVADDGTINLPMMLDPLPAEGATPAELQDRIAAKYREGNLIPTATVSVTVNSATTKPATQPGLVAAAKPTTHPDASQPTTLPVADDKVDVIVLVQKA